MQCFLNVKRAAAVAVTAALMVGSMLLASPRAHARIIIEPGPQWVYDYEDNDGFGQMQIVPGAYDGSTHQQGITVWIWENGSIYRGSGHWGHLLDAGQYIDFQMDGGSDVYWGWLTDDLTQGYGEYQDWRGVHQWVIEQPQ